MSLNFPIALAGKRSQTSTNCEYIGCTPPDPAYTYTFNADCSVRATFTGTSLPHGWEMDDANNYGVYFGTNLTSLNNSVFRNNLNLTEVYIPPTLTNGQIYAFWGCSNLHTVTFTGDFITMTAYAFRNCNALTMVKFCTGSPIGGLAGGSYGTFADCPNLTELHVPINAWYGVTSWLSKTVVKDQPEFIPREGSLTAYHSSGDIVWNYNRFTYGNSFTSNANVYTVDLGTKVQTMGNGCFGYCVNLAGDITFPSGFVSGSMFARAGANFDSMTFSEGITSISTSMFLQYTGNKQIDLVMPSTLLSIRDEGFNATGTTAWGELHLNEGLKTIGQQVWRNTRIGRNQTLVIPSTVTSIGRWSFSGSKFTRIEIKAVQKPSIGSTQFDGMTEVTDGSIHVPSNAVGYPVSIDGLTVVNDLPAGLYRISNNNFTSDTSGLQVVSASTELGGSFAAWKAYDNLASTSWLSTALPSWNKIDFGQDENITRITYNVRNDSGGVQAPKGYVIQSSDDDAVWTTRSTVTDGAKDQNNDITHDFDDQSASARYWRIYCTVGNGESRTGLEKLEWFGY